MRTLLSTLLLSTAALAQQVSLNLIQPPGQVRAGSSIQIQAVLTGATGKSIAAWEGVIRSTSGGIWKAVDGPTAVAAAKQFSCAAVTGTGEFKCLQAGINQNVLSDGVLGTYTLDIPVNATVGTITVVIGSTLGASLDGDGVPVTGNSVNFVLASPISKCDINGDGATNSQDIVLFTNQVLGLAACSSDLDGDGKCTVIDLSRIINASLTGVCR